MPTLGHDLIVVGAGTVGLAIADRFLERHPRASVLVCEDEDYPAASHAAGAMLVAWSEATAHSREREDFADNLADAESALRLWREDLDGAQVDGRCVVTSRGLNVVLAEGAPQAEVDNFEAIRQTARERGVPCESPDVDVVPGLDPDPERPMAKALYLPEELTVDARLLARWQRERLRNRGASFRSGRVRPVERGGAVTGVLTESGERIDAQAVVLAAGAVSRELVPKSTRDLVPPLYAGVGVGLVLRTVDTGSFDALRTPNRAFACGLHLLPVGDGRVYVGATNDPGTECPDRPSVSEVEFLMRSVVLQINPGLVNARVEGLRVGSRPTPADATPLLGPVMAGLWLASGHNRDGLTRAPQIARRLVSALDGDAGALPESHRPVRAPHSTWTASRALAHAEAQCRALAEETETRLATPHGNPVNRERFLANVRELYGDASPDYVLPPDLAILARSGRLPGEVRSWMSAWESTNVYTRGFVVRPLDRRDYS